ncbi:hypothetical protein BC834DRAFT_906653 [Gloeopeniophorella convolvens]|nr:hypothetical protein BC834DRAFT_906653 [Gloeopeniophorella convolvens]
MAGRLPCMLTLATKIDVPPLCYSIALTVSAEQEARHFIREKGCWKLGRCLFPNVTRATSRAGRRMLLFPLSATTGCGSSINASGFSRRIKAPEHTRTKSLLFINTNWSLCEKAAVNTVMSDSVFWCSGALKHRAVVAVRVSAISTAAATK